MSQDEREAKRDEAGEDAPEEAEAETSEAEAETSEAAQDAGDAKADADEAETSEADAEDGSADADADESAEAKSKGSKRSRKKSKKSKKKAAKDGDAKNDGDAKPAKDSDDAKAGDAKDDGDAKAAKAGDAKDDGDAKAGDAKAAKDGEKAAEADDAEADAAEADGDVPPAGGFRPSPLPPVPRRQRVRGGVFFAVGLFALFLLMANVEQLPHGALVGLVALVVAIRGLLELTGAIRIDPDAVPATPWRDTVFGQLEGEPVWAAPRTTVPIALLFLAGGVLAGYAALPWCIALALIGLLPSARRRPGLLVFCVVGLIYLPLLGTFALWDPWETHYGEVAREMVARDDWISLWWAQENWFWSKPILIFWSEALTFSALNVDVSPDANPLHPEWAVRLPVVAFSMAAVMVAYGTMKRVFGARAGVFAALVLASAPHFFFLSHQAITDMYLVSNMVMAVCMLILAFAEDPTRESRWVRFFGASWNAHALVMGGLCMLAIPQAMYLVTRNVEFYPDAGFAFVPDSFLYGSAGNPADLVPGNPAHRDVAPHVDALWAQPFAQGLLWAAGLALILFLLRRERRVQALQMTAFYVFCALAFMGKGIPGIALPGLVALFYLVASRRWNVLFDGQLRVGPGILITSVIGLPWYVAMFIRHGPGFTDRLLIHDHINRLASGVHGDTGSIQYFLWQLGYALFPWVALVPAAVLAWLWSKDRGVHGKPGVTPYGPYRDGPSGGDADALAARNRRETMMIVGLWFFVTFTLFSAMITKFHHYIFPAVPPAALLVGVLLDRLWGELGSKFEARASWMATAAAMLAPVPLALGFGLLWGDVRGVLPVELADEAGEDWVFEVGGSTSLGMALIAIGALAFVGGARWLWQHRLGAKAKGPKVTREDLSLGVAVGAGAVLVALVGRDLSWVTSARPQGYERLIHLFVYNYGRPWPEHFDYRPILTGFAITATVVLVALAFRWTRMAGARALLGLGLLFSAWTLNVYMVDLSPHWGMKELFAAYYADRDGPEEPVIAWQMNWKGENFYTGNRVHAFVDLDNRKIREWVGEHRGETAYFVFEHTRFGSFRNLMRGKEIEEITDKRLNNKFILVRIDTL